VLLLEKESAVGLHTSGRNSGVIHSGINALPGTLKARLCVEGNRLLRAYCAEKRVPFEEVGTLVVAIQTSQFPLLERLKQRGDANGVPGLKLLSGDQLRQKEPNAKGDAALFAPTGAIVDAAALTRSFAAEAQSKGVTIGFSQKVLRLKEISDGIRVQTSTTAYTAQLLINCAGLQSDRLAHQMGVGLDYVVAPFRGEYFAVKSDGNPLIHSMLYPIPHPEFPFLGIHVTKTVGGTILLGPNAVPAFGRESYKPGQWHAGDLFELIRSRGFWNALIGNPALVALGWNELRNSYSQRHFLDQASHLVNGLTLDRLVPETRVGIRPQLINQKGRLEDDLIIETTPHSIHILNVVSPGMTCSIAFAQWMSGRISSNLTWTGE
jgi:L-2-hydroxyglutarate oxidase LhgO